MNVFVIIGTVGGILYIIDILCTFGHGIYKHYKKYCKMRAYYDKNHKGTSEKMPIGFYTEMERAEIIEKKAS